MKEALIVALIPVLQAVITTVIEMYKKRKAEPQVNIDKFRRVLHEGSVPDVVGAMDEQSTRVQQALHSR